MFNTLKSKLLLNFNLNISSMSRMIFSGQLDRFKGFTVKMLDDNDMTVVSTEEFESSLKGFQSYSYLT